MQYQQPVVLLTNFQWGASRLEVSSTQICIPEKASEVAKYVYALEVSVYTRVHVHLIGQSRTKERHILCMMRLLWSAGVKCKLTTEVSYSCFTNTNGMQSHSTERIAINTLLMIFMTCVILFLTRVTDSTVLQIESQHSVQFEPANYSSNSILPQISGLISTH